MKKSFIWPGLILLGAFLVFAENPILDEISLALKAGNAKELSKYFDKTVELTLGEDEGAYSSVQAEQVLKDFFAKKKVKSFELIHNGSSENGSQYGIGVLTTENGSFRTYFLLKPKTPKYIIQEIRFEDE